MKLVWSPETSLGAYIDTVKSCKSFRESSGVPELLSAKAAGWNTRLIVETWSHGDPIATSIGLAVAARYTGGRHVCVVPDEQSRSEYVEAMRGAITMVSTEVVVGERVEEAVEGLDGVDFLVVDSKRRDFDRVLGLANLSNMGAVLVCKNATRRDFNGFRWHGVLKRGTRVVRTVFLPVGSGLDIAHVGSSGGSPGDPKRRPSRWIKHIDQRSGEEHVFRR